MTLCCEYVLALLTPRSCLLRADAQHSRPHRPWSYVLDRLWLVQRLGTGPRVAGDRPTHYESLAWRLQRPDAATSAASPGSSRPGPLRVGVARSPFLRPPSSARVRTMAVSASTGPGRLRPRASCSTRAVKIRRSRRTVSLTGVDLIPLPVDCTTWSTRARSAISARRRCGLAVLGGARSEANPDVDRSGRPPGGARPLIN